MVDELDPFVRTVFDTVGMVVDTVNKSYNLRLIILRQVGGSYLWHQESKF